MSGPDLVTTVKIPETSLLSKSHTSSQYGACTLCYPTEYHTCVSFNYGNKEYAL